MENFGSRKKVFILLAALCAIAAMAPCARADMYTENLTHIGAGLNCTPACTGPYASLTVDLLSNTQAQITVNGLSNSSYNYLIGDDQQALLLNVNANNVSVVGGSVSATQLPGFTAPTFNFSYSPTYFSFDSLGYFNFQVSETGDENFNTSATQIQFTLQDNSGVWGSAEDVLADKGTFLHNYDVGVPVYACPAATCSARSTDYITGDVAASAVPEPGSILLLGTALVIVGGAIRRRF